MYSSTVLELYSLKVLQSYSLTVLQSYSLTVLQSYSPTVLQSYSVTVLQSIILQPVGMVQSYRGEPTLSTIVLHSNQSRELWLAAQLFFSFLFSTNKLSEVQSQPSGQFCSINDDVNLEGVLQAHVARKI